MGCREYNSIMDGPITDYLTVAEFAAKAKITRIAVNKMIYNKKIKAIMVGKTYLIHKEYFSQYIANRIPR